MFFMLKIKYLLFKHELVDKWMRKKYCHKGFHKLFHSFYGSSKGNQRMRYVHFLKCRFCNYIFFARETDKKRYLELTTRERSALTNWLSGAKSKHSNTRVAKKDKDASVR